MPHRTESACETQGRKQAWWHLLQNGSYKYTNSQQYSLVYISCLSFGGSRLQISVSRTNTRLLASRRLSLVLKLRTEYFTSSCTLRLNQVPTQQLTNKHNNKHNNYTEQSPSWEASRPSGSQEITRILWNPEVHYRIHKSPPSVPIPNHFSLVHPTSWRSILILSSNLCLRIPSGLFPLGFPTITLYATCPTHHLIHLVFIILITFGTSYKSCRSSLRFLHSPVTSSLLS